MNELALFAGAGGGILAGKQLGWRTVCGVEIDPYCASVLAQRQNEGLLPPFPIWDDVCTFDGTLWRGIVDVVSGGFPCQDISCAGNKTGLDGERSKLWVEMARIIDEVRPRYAFVENSPMLTKLGLGYVLGDLATMGFDARWGVYPAAPAPHKRERIWIAAYTNSDRPQRINPIPSATPRQKREWLYVKRVVSEVQQGQRDCIPESWISRKSDGLAARVDRTKALGNGQVPAAAIRAWNELIGTD